MSINKEKPMIIFTTSAVCGACERIRGRDGKPKDELIWNSKLIREILIGSDNKLKATCIINIHDSVTYPSIDNIVEFTSYYMIPSNLIVTPDFFMSLIETPDSYFGYSILRVKISRQNNGSINFYIEIDGEPNDSRCEEIEKQVDEYYLWNYIPHEFSRLRDFFKGISKEKIEDILPDLRDDPFHDILMKEYNKYVVDHTYYENQMRVRYGFTWFISFFYPERIRELQSFYPTWTIVLPSEWSKGLTDQEAVRDANRNKVNSSSVVIPKLRPIYGKVVGCKVYMDGPRFTSVKTSGETVVDCLKQYYANRLFLTYEEVLLNTNGQSGPDIKNVVNKETGTNYRIVTEGKKDTNIKGGFPM